MTRATTDGGVDPPTIAELRELAKPPGINDYLEVYGPRSGYDRR